MLGCPDSVDYALLALRHQFVCNKAETGDQKARFLLCMRGITSSPVTKQRPATRLLGCTHSVDYGLLALRHQFVCNKAETGDQNARMLLCLDIRLLLPGWEFREPAQR